jgi:hypothetical protein
MEPCAPFTPCPAGQVDRLPRLPAAVAKIRDIHKAAVAQAGPQRCADTPGPGDKACAVFLREAVEAEYFLTANWGRADALLKRRSYTSFEAVIDAVEAENSRTRNGRRVLATLQRARPDAPNLLATTLDILSGAKARDEVQNLSTAAADITQFMIELGCPGGTDLAGALVLSLRQCTLVAEAGGTKEAADDDEKLVTLETRLTRQAALEKALFTALDGVLNSLAANGNAPGMARGGACGLTREHRLVSPDDCAKHLSNGLADRLLARLPDIAGADAACGTAGCAKALERYCAASDRKLGAEIVIAPLPLPIAGASGSEETIRLTRPTDGATRADWRVFRAGELQLRNLVSGACVPTGTFVSELSPRAINLTSGVRRGASPAQLRALRDGIAAATGIPSALLSAERQSLAVEVEPASLWPPMGPGPMIIRGPTKVTLALAAPMPRNAEGPSWPARLNLTLFERSQANAPASYLDMAALDEQLKTLSDGWRKKLRDHLRADPDVLWEISSPGSPACRSEAASRNTVFGGLFQDVIAIEVLRPTNGGPGMAACAIYQLDENGRVSFSWMGLSAEAEAELRRRLRNHLAGQGIASSAELDLGNALTIQAVTFPADLGDSFGLLHIKTELAARNLLSPGSEAPCSAGDALGSSATLQLSIAITHEGKSRIAHNGVGEQALRKAIARCRAELERAAMAGIADSPAGRRLRKLIENLQAEGKAALGRTGDLIGIVVARAEQEQTSGGYRLCLAFGRGKNRLFVKDIHAGIVDGRVVLMLSNAVAVDRSCDGAPLAGVALAQFFGAAEGLTTEGFRVTPTRDAGALAFRFAVAVPRLGWIEAGSFSLAAEGFAITDDMELSRMRELFMRSLQLKSDFDGERARRGLKAALTAEVWRRSRASIERMANGMKLTACGPGEHPSPDGEAAVSCVAGGAPDRISFGRTIALPLKLAVFCTNDLTIGGSDPGSFGRLSCDTDMVKQRLNAMLPKSDDAISVTLLTANDHEVRVAIDNIEMPIGELCKAKISRTILTNRRVERMGELNIKACAGGAQAFLPLGTVALVQPGATVDLADLATIKLTGMLTMNGGDADASKQSGKLLRIDASLTFDIRAQRARLTGDIIMFDSLNAAKAVAELDLDDALFGFTAETVGELRRILQFNGQGCLAPVNPYGFALAQSEVEILSLAKSDALVLLNWGTYDPEREGAPVPDIAGCRDLSPLQKQMLADNDIYLRLEDEILGVQTDFTAVSQGSLDSMTATGSVGFDVLGITAATVSLTANSQSATGEVKVLDLGFSIEAPTLKRLSRAQIEDIVRSLLRPTFPTPEQLAAALKNPKIAVAPLTWESGRSGGRGSARVMVRKTAAERDAMLTDEGVLKPEGAGKGEATQVSLGSHKGGEPCYVDQEVLSKVLADSMVLAQYQCEFIVAIPDGTGSDYIIRAVKRLEGTELLSFQKLTLDGKTLFRLSDFDRAIDGHFNGRWLRYFPVERQPFGPRTIYAQRISNSNFNRLLRGGADFYSFVQTSTHEDKVGFHRFVDDDTLDVGIACGQKKCRFRPVEHRRASATWTLKMIGSDSRLDRIVQATQWRAILRSQTICAGQRRDEFERLADWLLRGNAYHLPKGCPDPWTLLYNVGAPVPALPAPTGAAS